MEDGVRQEWLCDLEEEAVQYREIYRARLSDVMDPIKRRLLERNMMDKQAQIQCLRALGARSRAAEEPEEERISWDLLLYNESENQSTYAALAAWRKEAEPILAKQRQIVQRLMAFLLNTV